MPTGNHRISLNRDCAGRVLWGCICAIATGACTIAAPMEPMPPPPTVLPSLPTVASAVTPSVIAATATLSLATAIAPTAPPGSPTRSPSATSAPATATPQPTPAGVVAPSPTLQATLKQPAPDTLPTRKAASCSVGDAAITNLNNGQQLSGVVQVEGRAYCNDFAYYKFEFVDARCGPTQLCFVAGRFETPIRAGVLMNWDTRSTWDGSPLPNGQYVLQLTVVGRKASGEAGPIFPKRPRLTVIINN